MQLSFTEQHARAVGQAAAVAAMCAYADELARQESAIMPCILLTARERRHLQAAKLLSDDSLQEERLEALRRGQRCKALQFHNEQMARWARRHGARS
jgi:hypothetical protein